MGEIVRMQNVGCVSYRTAPADDGDVAARSREVIRLWNRMRAQERALASASAPQAQAELFALRRQLQQAFAERDRLIASVRSRREGD